MLRATIRGAVFAAAFFAAIVVFRLGWFFLIVIVVGAVAAVMVEARLGPTDADGSKVGAIAAALGSYLVVFAILVGALGAHQSVRSLQATWQVRETVHSSREAEVFLEFVDYPSHGIGVYSTALRDRLAAGGAMLVPIEFSVTSDLGCIRGFRPIRIGEIVDPSVINGKGWYARGGQAAASPWARDFWWCH